MLHERGVPIFRIFKRQRGDIDWMESSRYTETLPQTPEKNDNTVNLNPSSQRKTDDIDDKYLVLKFFVRKPCLITKQIKELRISIRVNYYTPKCSRTSICVNFLTFTNLVWGAALINVRINFWHAESLSTNISCSKVYQIYWDS